jgi:hypothetical protein
MENLKTNKTILFNYLTSLYKYESLLCLDFEQLNIDFYNINGEYYVPSDMMPYFFFKELLRQICPNVSLLFMEEIVKEIDPSLYYRILELTNYGNRELEINKIEKLDKNTELYENTKQFIEKIIKEIKQKNNNIEIEMAKLFEKNDSIGLFNYCRKYVEFHRYSFLYMYQELINGNSMSPILSYKNTQKITRRKSLPNSSKKMNSRITKKYNSI